MGKSLLMLLLGILIGGAGGYLICDVGHKLNAELKPGVANTKQGVPVAEPELKGEEVRASTEGVPATVKKPERLKVAVAQLPTVWLSGEAPKAWAKDEVYVLEFWATWCGPCVKAMPHMEALWQAVKGEGIHIIGINLDDASRTSPESIAEFLKKQPVQPTYSIALERDEKLSALMGVRGIPHAALLVNGEQVWTGHPAHLTVERLRALRTTGKMPPPGTKRVESGTQKPVDNPYAAMQSLEMRAGKAAEAGNWAEAVSFQRQAILVHPLQKHLEKPFLPAVQKRLSTRVTEAKGALTVTALWQYPWWVKKFTQEDMSLLPGEAEAYTFTAPYTLKTLVDVKSKAETEALKAQVGAFDTVVEYRDAVDPAAFKVNEKYKYPFVQVALDGVVLYIGALETMPSVFRGPLLTVDGYRKAMEAEKVFEQKSKEAFLALRNGNATLAENMKMTDGYASLAMPYLFAAAHKANDLKAGAQVFANVLATYQHSPGVLEALAKLLEAWPQLTAAEPALCEQLYRLLAQYNPKRSPAYASGYYLHAASAAEEQKAFTRAQAYRRQAIACSAQTKRLADFQEKTKSLPSF